MSKVIDNKIFICPKCEKSTVKHGFKIRKGHKIQQYRCGNGHILYTIDLKVYRVK